MSDLRERFASDLASNHLEGGETERPIDRIAAHASASRLGRALWRWKYAGQEDMAHECLQALLRVMSRRWSVPPRSPDYVMLVRIAKQVLVEWRHESCERCHGAAEVWAGRLRMRCEACDGRGTRIYGDFERITAVTDGDAPPRERRALWQAWERRFHEARGMVLSHDTQTLLVMRDKLERGYRPDPGVRDQEVLDYQNAIGRMRAATSSAEQDSPGIAGLQD
jgi:hypothetical protein